MNSRPLKRQLLAAILSVAVAFVALSASTYAWFVQNNKVTAEGMSIAAQTDGISFEIAVSDDDIEPQPDKVSGQTVASYDSLSALLFPTHPDVTGTITLDSLPTWVHAFSNDYDDAAVAAQTVNLNTTVDYSKHLLQAEEKDYALVATYFLHLNGQATAPETVIENIGVTEATITGVDNSNLKQSVAVLIVGENGVASIPYGTTSSNQIICNSVNAADDIWHQVDVYVYFDGKNENCKSAFFDSNAVNVTLVFGSIA